MAKMALKCIRRWQQSLSTIYWPGKSFLQSLMIHIYLFCSSRHGLAWCQIWLVAGLGRSSNFGTLLASGSRGSVTAPLNNNGNSSTSFIPSLPLPSTLLTYFSILAARGCFLQHVALLIVLAGAMPRVCIVPCLCDYSRLSRGWREQSS